MQYRVSTNSHFFLNLEMSSAPPIATKGPSFHQAPGLAMLSVTASLPPALLGALSLDFLQNDKENVT